MVAKKSQNKKFNKFSLNGIILSAISVFFILCFFIGLFFLKKTNFQYNYDSMIVFIVIGILLLLSSLAGLVCFILSLIKKSEKEIIAIAGLIIDFIIIYVMFPYVRLLIQMYALFTSKIVGI